MDNDILDSRKLQRPETYIFEPESFEDNIARLQGCGVKLIPIEYGGYKRQDQNYLDLVDRLPVDVLTITRYKKFNFGVELGACSQNLFFVTVSSKADCDDVSQILNEYDRWITTDQSKYHIWLRLENAIVEGCQTPKYQIQSEGVILVPPSVHPDGDSCCWIKREGANPPLLNEAELRKMFPQIKIKASKIPKTNELQVHIKNKEIARAISFVTSKPWPGRSGVNLLKVYVVCCCRADKEGSIDCFRASEREIAEEAGVSRKIVRKYLKLLIGMKYLSKVSFPSLTSHYKINLDVIQKSDVDIQISGKILPIIKNDAFARKCLRPSGAQIYHSLSLKPQATLKDIVLATGRGYSTVKSAVRLLQANSLVIKENGLWIAQHCDKEMLKKIAVANGVDGRYHEIKKKHRKERRSFVSSQIWSSNF